MYLALATTNLHPSLFLANGNSLHTFTPIIRLILAEKVSPCLPLVFYPKSNPAIPSIQNHLFAWYVLWSSDATWLLLSAILFPHPPFLVLLYLLLCPNMKHSVLFLSWIVAKSIRFLTRFPGLAQVCNLLGWFWSHMLVTTWPLFMQKSAKANHHWYIYIAKPESPYTIVHSPVA